MAGEGRRYYEVVMEAAQAGGYSPIVMMQVGDGYDAYVYSYAERSWLSDPDMFARRVVNGDRFTRREVDEAAARGLVDGAGGRFDGAPLVNGSGGEGR